MIRKMRKRSSICITFYAAMAWVGFVLPRSAVATEYGEKIRVLLQEAICRPRFSDRETLMKAKEETAWAKYLSSSNAASASQASLGRARSTSSLRSDSVSGSSLKLTVPSSFFAIVRINA